MPLSNDAPTLHHYRVHLLMIAAWLGPLERALAHFDDGPQHKVSALARMPLIERDLADMALPARHASEIAPVKAWEMIDAAYRWGVCYVIEGSQLGGAVLYKQLRDALAPHALRYLSGDGVPPGPRWKHFIEAMRASVREPADIKQACAGAVDAFDSLLSLLPQGVTETSTGS